MLSKIMLNYEKLGEDSLTNTKLEKTTGNWCNGKILLIW